MEEERQELLAEWKSLAKGTDLESVVERKPKQERIVKSEPDKKKREAIEKLLGSFEIQDEKQSGGDDVIDII